ncbi:hypothetical protein CU097_000805, partial [Rhizopus azygosporus]
ARDSNIPYIITSSYAAFPDASAAYINNHLLTMENPTTYGLSFFKRFYDMFVIPVQAYLQVKPIGDWINERRREAATGLGDFLNPKLSQEEANDMVKRVGLDVDGSIQQNVKRYKALIQIHSQNGSIRGADIIEEVLFVNKDTYLPYRYPVSRQMSFIKAHNLDLIAAALVLFMGIICSFVLLVKAAFHLMLAYIWQKGAPIDPAKMKLKTI